MESPWTLHVDTILFLSASIIGFSVQLSSSYLIDMHLKSEGIAEHFHYFYKFPKIFCDKLSSKHTVMRCEYFISLMDNDVLVRTVNDWSISMCFERRRNKDGEKERCVQKGKKGPNFYRILHFWSTIMFYFLNNFCLHFFALAVLWSGIGDWNQCTKTWVHCNLQNNQIYHFMFRWANVRHVCKAYRNLS